MIRVYLHDADFTLLRSLNYFFLPIHIIERFLKFEKDTEDDMWNFSFQFCAKSFLEGKPDWKNIFLKCGNFRDNKRFFSLWLFFMLLTFSTTSFRYLNTLSGKGSCNRFFSWFFIQIIQVYVHISGFDRHGIFFPIISSFIVAMKKKNKF